MTFIKKTKTQFSFGWTTSLYKMSCPLKKKDMRSHNLKTCINFTSEDQDQKTKTRTGAVWTIIITLHYQQQSETTTESDH